MSSAQSPGGEGREQDRLLPVANIQRIMRRLLPADEKISKDAKEILQESLSEFICFVTEEAAGRCAELCINQNSTAPTESSRRPLRHRRDS